MEVVVMSDVDRVASYVADTIEHRLGQMDPLVLGLATGSSPLATYAELVRRHRHRDLSFAGVTAFTLDEYVGLAYGHPESYRSVVRREFVEQVDLATDRLHSPDVRSADLIEMCAAYERQIVAVGGVDVQILGVGTDGHIGFNEPSSSLASRTRIKTLTSTTRRDNARFFGGDIEAVPKHVITQGIGTILDARHLILIATGEQKADAVRATVEGPITAMVPASALQMHPHATVVIDEEAASDLTLVEYFKETHAQRPEWQRI